MENENKKPAEQSKENYLIESMFSIIDYMKKASDQWDKTQEYRKLLDECANELDNLAVEIDQAVEGEPMFDAFTTGDARRLIHKIRKAIKV